MFALLACLTLCQVQEKEINIPTEINFGSADDSTKNNRYAIILNSGDFLKQDDLEFKYVQCPAIIQNPGKTTFHHKDSKMKTIKYAVVDIPKDEGFNVIINSITVPLLLNPLKHSGKQKTNLVVVSDQQIKLHLNTNSNTAVKYQFEGNSNSENLNAFDFDIGANKIFRLYIDWSNLQTASGFIFMIREIELLGILDKNTNYNCGAFYYEDKDNFFNLAQDCRIPTLKENVTRLDTYEKDVFIGEPQKIAVPAQSFVTLVLLQYTKEKIKYFVTMNDGIVVRAEGTSQNSFYFHTEGTLEIKSDYVPYVRVNYIKTQSWPKKANVYVKTGLAPIQITSDITGNFDVHEKDPFILVSANNYGYLFNIGNCGNNYQFYNYNGTDTMNLVDPAINYREYPGAFYLTINQGSYCRFFYSVNGREYNYEVDGVTFNSEVQYSLQVGTEPEEKPDHDKMKLYITIGAAAGGAVVLIVLIIIVIACCIKKKGDKSSSTSSSSK